MGRRRGGADRPRHRAVRRARSRTARERPRHARRPLSLRALRRAAPAARLGPPGWHDPRPQGCPPASRHERRHDPRPRALRRPPPRRPPCRGARRGDGLRGPARPDVPARRDDLAHRGHHPRPRDRHAGTRSPRGGPVLEGRRHRPPGGAREGDRRLRARGGYLRAGGARDRVRPRSPGRREPRDLPARAAGRDSGGPLRRDDRRRALPRRDRRLAPVHPLAVRRQGPRRLGARAVAADPRGARPRGRRDLVRRRDRRPPAGCRRAAPGRSRADRAGRGRGPGGGRAVRLGALRRPLPRERRALAPDPARLPGQAHAALAAAPSGSEPPGGGEGLPALPGDPRDVPRVPARRPRRPGSRRSPPRSRLAQGLARRGGDADGVAVRVVAPLRLRRHVHVRGGHAQR